MSSLRFINRLTLLLLLIVGLLSFIVFKLWQDLQAGQYLQEIASTTQPAQSVTRKVPFQQGLISFTPPPVSMFNEILERPLFTNGRLPPDEPIQTVDNQPKVQLKLRLEGIASAGDKSFALVRDLSNNQLLRLQQGMQHQGWTVKEVKQGSAEFTRGQESTELEFDLEKGTKVPPPLRRPPRPAGVRKRPSR